MYVGQTFHVPATVKLVDMVANCMYVLANKAPKSGSVTATAGAVTTGVVELVNVDVNPFGSVKSSCRSVELDISKFVATLNNLLLSPVDIGILKSAL